MLSVNQVTFCRIVIHDPVFPVIEEEVSICLPIEFPWDAILVQKTDEPTEFQRISAPCLETIEVRDIRHGLGEYPLLSFNKGPGSI